VPAEDGAGAGEGRREAELVQAEPATLELRLVDARDGAPVASAVDLVRLGPGLAAPPRRVEVPLEGAVLPGLPAGRYRAHVHARRRAADDPPAFELVAPRGEVELPVQLPSAWRVLLGLRDEEGRPLRMARASSGYEGLPAAAPPFVVDAQGVGQLAEERAAPMDFGSRHLSAEEDGRFVLGHARDLDCDAGGSPWYELVPRDRCAVRLELPGHELSSEDFPDSSADELVFVALSVPDDWFAGAILLPDGSRAVDRGLELTVRGEPVPATTDDAWRRAPVRVRAELAGYEPLEFVYRAADGPPAERRLRPR
jgi:hypothetical protein